MGFSVFYRRTFNAGSVMTKMSKAQEALANEILKDTNQFVPALTGSLSARARVKDGQIIYPGPYARFLWEGKLMVDPNTGSSYAKSGVTKVATSKSLVFSRAMHGQAQSHWLDASKAVNMEKWEKVYKGAFLRG